MKPLVYIDTSIIGDWFDEESAAWSLHIPIASVDKVDVLVSWNFQQIVNLKRIHAFNAVNLTQAHIPDNRRKSASKTMEQMVHTTFCAGGRTR
jgi:hypothetical protein